jgi:hypothetical protein
MGSELLLEFKEEKSSMADTNTHSSERALNNQREEEVIEIDENGVVHAVGYTPSQFKSTVLRDPEGEYGDD